MPRPIERGGLFRKWPTGFGEPKFKKESPKIEKKGEIMPEDLTLGKLVEMLEKKEISSSDIRSLRRWQDMSLEKKTLPEEFRKRIEELIKKSEGEIEKGEK